jgi:hypothetical protein
VQLRQQLAAPFGMPPAAAASPTATNAFDVQQAQNQALAAALAAQQLSSSLGLTDGQGTLSSSTYKTTDGNSSSNWQHPSLGVCQHPSSTVAAAMNEGVRLGAFNVTSGPGGLSGNSSELSPQLQQSIMLLQQQLDAYKGR